jgi:2-hydroxy-3-keto-5-methylthiopentenyl-1-phosphate phosphatase
MKRNLNPSPVAVLCDFDNTISTRDVTELIYDLFAGPECNEYRRQWREGLITTPQELEGCLSSVNASREEIETSLEMVQLDPAFVDLVHWCEQKEFEFAIVSEGLDWYIYHFLDKIGMDGIRIYANRAEFSPSGIRLSYPWRDPKVPARGTSKGTIVREYQQRGMEVVFIGDGSSDLEAAQSADRVFAKAKLMAYCQRSGILAVEFHNLAQVLADLKRIYPE